jgi:hypothetical protein
MKIGLDKVAITQIHGAAIIVILIVVAGFGVYFAARMGHSNRENKACG